MRERSGIVTTAAAALLSTLLIPVAAVAQGTLSVEAEDVECLPIANNGVAWTTVRNNVPDTESCLQRTDEILVRLSRTLPMGIE